MNDDQYKALSEIAYKTKDTVDRLETNWEMDRKDFAEFQNRLGHLEVEFKQLRDQILLLPKRTNDRMTGIVGEIKQEAEDLRQETQDLKEVIASSEVVTEKKVSKAHWWQFKRNGGKK